MDRRSKDEQETNERCRRLRYRVRPRGDGSAQQKSVLKGAFHHGRCKTRGDGIRPTILRSIRDALEGFAEGEEKAKGKTSRSRS